MIRRNLLAAAAVAALALGAGVAPAKAVTYNFTFDGAALDVAGQFSTDGSNNVTSIVGTVTGVASGPITGLIGGASPFYSGNGGNGWTFSNTWNMSTSTFNGDGVLFSFGAGNFGNIYSVSGGTFFSVDGSPGNAYFNPGDAGRLSASPVPGPILGAGLPGLVMAGFGLLALARHRRKHAVA